jgi:hypothetical protein
MNHDTVEVVGDGQVVTAVKALNKTLNEEIEIRAKISAVRRRRLHTTATIKLVRTGEVLATSKARWYDMPERIFTRMFHRSPLSTERLAKLLAENKKRGKIIRKKFKKS